MHSTLALAGALAILGGGATASPSPYTPHPVWLQRRAANTVDLYASDASYIPTVNLTIGTPPQSLRASVPLNSVLLEVPTGPSNLATNNLVTLFNPNASTTLANVTAVGQPENQEYYATDTVTLDKEYPKTPIFTSEFSKDFAYNGTRGSADIASGFTRGWSTSLGLGINSTVPLVENLAEEWTNKTIGIYLEPKKAPSGDLPKTGEWKKTGEITFGGIDTSRIDGEVTYFAATSDEQWTVPLTGISVDGTDIGVSTKNLYTFVDTGDSYVAYVPTDIFKAIGSALGSGGDGDRTVLPVGCNSEKTIEFNIGGDAFKLTPDQWLSSELGGSGCHINIKSHKEDSIVLTGGFLRTVYTALNVETKQVGFAKLANATASTTSTTPKPTKNSGAGHSLGVQTVAVVAAVLGATFLL